MIYKRPKVEFIVFEICFSPMDIYGERRDDCFIFLSFFFPRCGAREGVELGTAS